MYKLIIIVKYYIFVNYMIDCFYEIIFNNVNFGLVYILYLKNNNKII